MISCGCDISVSTSNIALSVMYFGHSVRKWFTVSVRPMQLLQWPVECIFNLKRSTVSSNLSLLFLIYGEYFLQICSTYIHMVDLL